MAKARWTPPGAGEFIRAPFKAWRAAAIRSHLDHVYGRGLKGVVCFTCGNSADALRKEGLRVVEVGAKGPIAPTRWWGHEDIAFAWPNHFDATSGHLSVPLMLDIARLFKAQLGNLDDHRLAGGVYVPSGSGETAVCLALAYPELPVIACYGATNGPETEYNKEAPLNGLVQRLCHVEHVGPAAPKAC